MRNPDGTLQDQDTFVSAVGKRVPVRLGRDGAFDRLPPFARFLLRLVLNTNGKRLHAIYGLERVEALARRNAPVIFALRHPNLSDTVTLGCLLMQALELRPISFMIDWMFIYAPVLDKIIASIKPIPVWRKRARWPWLQKRKPDHRPDPLEVASQRLRQGISVGIFPEGIRNTDHRALGRFRGGTIRLALESGCPVVPVGFAYSQTADATAGLVVRIGPALHFDNEAAEWLDLPENATARTTIERKLSHRLRNEIAKLSEIAVDPEPETAMAHKNTRAVGAAPQTETVDHGGTLCPHITKSASPN